MSKKTTILVAIIVVLIGALVIVMVATNYSKERPIVLGYDLYTCEIEQLVVYNNNYTAVQNSVKGEISFMKLSDNKDVIDGDFYYNGKKHLLSHKNKNHYDVENYDWSIISLLENKPSLSKNYSYSKIGLVLYSKTTHNLEYKMHLKCFHID